MLVLLGGQVFYKLLNGSIIHSHNHDHHHTHIHGSHDHDDETNDHHDQSHPFLTLFPFFRPKSFIIGLIHGMAGSAAVMLAILPTTLECIFRYSFLDSVFCGDYVINVNNDNNFGIAI